jgi:hypothetical protein
LTLVGGFADFAALAGRWYFHQRRSASKIDRAPQTCGERGGDGTTFASTATQTVRPISAGPDQLGRRPRRVRFLIGAVGTAAGLASPQATLPRSFWVKRRFLAGTGKGLAELNSAEPVVSLARQARASHDVLNQLLAQLVRDKQRNRVVAALLILRPSRPGNSHVSLDRGFAQVKAHRRG